jgi:hypothetical protein
MPQLLKAAINGLEAEERILGGPELQGVACELGSNARRERASVSHGLFLFLRFVGFS